MPLTTLSAEPSTSQPAGSLVGCEWVVDASGCDPDALRDLIRVRSICELIVDDLGLKVVGSPHWHQFAGEAGVTGLYLLSESHLACHTYPEHGLATWNLYCCRSRPRWAWESHLADRLGAESVRIHEIPRGNISVLDPSEDVLVKQDAQG